jgi:hypothetical protein
MRNPSVVCHEEDLKPTIETKVTIFRAAHLGRCEPMRKTSDSKIRTEVLGRRVGQKYKMVINAATHRVRAASLQEHLCVLFLITRKDSVYD